MAFRFVTPDGTACHRVHSDRPKSFEWAALKALEANPPGIVTDKLVDAYVTTLELGSSIT